MSIIYPEGDWKHFKGTGRKPFFFMCKFCSQIIYKEDSDAWNDSCPNCDIPRKFMPITFSTTLNWLNLTTGWFKEELIAQLLESSTKKHIKIGGIFYNHLFVKGTFKFK